MPKFNSVKDLQRYIKQQATQALQQKESNVKNTVVDEMRLQIETNIYDAYTPSMYERKKDQGGLTDLSNFEASPTADGVAIFSTREATDKSGQEVTALEIIEGYKEYSMEDKGSGFSAPRHAVEPTREALRSGGRLTEAFKKDLKLKGLDVK